MNLSLYSENVMSFLVTNGWENSGSRINCDVYQTHVLDLTLC